METQTICPIPFQLEKGAYADKEIKEHTLPRGTLSRGIVSAHRALVRTFLHKKSHRLPAQRPKAPTRPEFILSPRPPGQVLQIIN